MKENKWQFLAITRDKANVEGLEWLPTEHKEQLLNLLEYGGLTRTLNEDITSDESTALSFIDKEGTETNVTMQVVTLGQDTRLEISQSASVPFFARVLHLEKREEAIYERTIAIDNNEIIIDRKEPTDKEFVGNAGMYEFLGQAAKDYSDDISVSAWYDDIPCVANGCCMFIEAAWPGGPIMPIPYKWCGANCGSGEPINSLDTCCRSHDWCYASFSKYPDRCACDQNLIDCASRISGNSSLLVRTAFKIKMNNEKC